MSDYPPKPLDLSAMESVCSATTNGWLWYCDECDTHGNADSQEEAEHMADAHVGFWLPDERTTSTRARSSCGVAPSTSAPRKRTRPRR
jgi:hypothetical protein